MREPQDLAREVEENPVLPSDACERVSGYGVMGLPFKSGHVLGLRRWTASSVGEAFTSIWHRDPEGRWTFYESATCEVACTRYFGADVQRVCAIRLAWDGPRRLRIETEGGAVSWTVDIGSTVVTRMMSAIGGMMPDAAWRWQPILGAMGLVAGWSLGVGKVQLTGRTSHAQRFDANPKRIFYVTASQAVVEGMDLGPMGPLPTQARIADFYIPQRGIFAVGRVFVTPDAVTVPCPQ